MTLRVWRKLAYDQLEPAAREDHGLSWTNRILIVVIVLAAAGAVLETEPSIATGREHFFLGLEIVAGVIFSIEYLARLWIVPENPHWHGKSFARLRYALTPAALIDLVAVLPTLMALEFGSGALLLRFFRVLRILRLAKLGRLSHAWGELVEAVATRKHELLLTISVALAIMLLASTLMYWAEGTVQPDKFGSIPRTMWWCIVTLTTVGYGDVTPVTVLGKFLSGLVAIAGIGLIAMPTGILAAAFSDVVQSQRLEAARIAEQAAREAEEDDDIDDEQTEQRRKHAERMKHLAEHGTLPAPGVPKV
jgi:voltage-gated potassium channel